jgi:hypothetical protein
MMLDVYVLEQKYTIYNATNGASVGAKDIDGGCSKYKR